MNRINTLFGATLVAASFVGSSALAADQTPGQTSSDKADKTQVVPSRDDLQPGAAPTVERMDDNVQRQHDRNRSGSAQGSSDGAAAGGDKMAAQGGETRDWAAIDTNNDNLISPEEMEAALEAAGPQAAEPKR